MFVCVRLQCYIHIERQIVVFFFFFLSESFNATVRAQMVAFEQRKIQND